MWCLGETLQRTADLCVFEAGGGMCCFFQGLFLIEVRGIRLPILELKILALTTAWKECVQT